MCPHTTIYVSSYYYTCVRILLCVFILLCVLILHINHSNCAALTCPSPARLFFFTLCVSSYYDCYIYVLMLLYMCPHTPVYVSSCYYIGVVLLLYMCPYTAIHVSSSYDVCVLILLCVCVSMCPHTTRYSMCGASRYAIPVAAHPPYATRVGGLKGLVFEALSYSCFRP